MNRFCKSTFSLLLATLLLFSAAGISFGMVLQSTHAYAVGPSVETPAPAPDEEDQQETSGQDEQEKPQETEQPEEQPPASTWSPQDQKINIMGEEKDPEKKDEIQKEEGVDLTIDSSENMEQDDLSQVDTSKREDAEDDSSIPRELTGSIIKATFNGKNLQNNVVDQQSGPLVLTISIMEITETQFKTFEESKNIEFDAGVIFTPADGSEFFIPNISKIKKQDTGISFEIAVDAQYNGTSDTKSVPFTLTFTKSDQTKSVFSKKYSINPEVSSNERVMISSVIFKDQDDNILSKVTPGTRGRLTVIVKDTRINSEEEFEKFKPKMKPKINADAFSCHSQVDSDKDIKLAGPIYSDGIEYEIIFRDVTYKGQNNYLILELNYNGLYYIDYPLDRYDLYEPAPDDDNSNNNYPDDDDDHDSSSSKPDIPPPTPNIIVSTYDYGGGNVTAAGNFTLTMTLMNTSKRVNVDNVVMKLSVPEAFTLTSSSNTFYIERIAKRSSVERTVNLSVKPNADAISHPIKVSFTYESVINDERKQFSAEQDISIPVSQLDRFSLNPVEMPSEIYVGEDSSIEATFVNKGKSTVYNVTAEITGNLSQPGQRQFIGNVESGKEESADFLIGALEAGTISGEVVISYEDANMNVNELRSPFTTTAVSFEMPAPDPGLDVMNPDDIGEAPPEPWYQKIPAWGWTTGGVTAIILLSFAAKAMRRHRELKLLEDSDEDF